MRSGDVLMCLLQLYAVLALILCSEMWWCTYALITTAWCFGPDNMFKDVVVHLCAYYKSMLFWT